MNPVDHKHAVYRKVLRGQTLTDDNTMHQGMKTLYKLVSLQRFEEAWEIFYLVCYCLRSSFMKEKLPLLWEPGAEIITALWPDRLTDYMKIVYLNSTQAIASFSFNAFIEFLIKEKNWDKVLDECEAVYESKAFNQADLSKYMAIAAYNKWHHLYYIDRKSDDPTSDEQTWEYLNKAMELQPNDLPIIQMYYKFMMAVRPRAKQSFMEKCLSIHEQSKDHRLLLFIVGNCKDESYFDMNKYIWTLYHKQPTLDSSYGLYSTVKNLMIDFKHRSLEKKMEYMNDRIMVCLFNLFIDRLENAIIDLFFMKFIRRTVFEYMNDELADIYRNRNVEDTLQHPQLYQHLDAHKLKLSLLRLHIKKITKSYRLYRRRQRT
ncbi:hypothetical protein BDB01DRAFT_848760 [Pilobolus umbonatus]|nr:hypothetical protein BDB01DRAFT_848760 [Pilobolus umbonatus]